MSEEKVIINQTASNRPITGFQFAIVVSDPTKIPYPSNYDVMFRHPETDELHFASKLSVNHETKSIIIS